MSEVRPFVHLHCHTQFSLLDGANRIPDLVAKAKADGMTALAITDHGNLYGVLKFYSECREQHIKPILGYEAYVAPGNRGDRTTGSMKEASFHLTLLAMNRIGFQNLIKMASLAYLEGFYYRPRIDKELLEDFNEGILCLSGCASSELSQLILREKTSESRKLIAWYQKVFGDRFYLEIQNCGLEIQRTCKEGTIDLAERMGLPLVATNDAHYLHQDDASAHDVLLCVNTRTVRSDVKRMRMEGNQFYVKSPAQMYEAFADCTDAVARTQEIADRVNIDLDLNTRHFPVFAAPQDKTDTQYLRELCQVGLKDKYGEELTDEHHVRLDYELSIIDRMGFSSYFLIVWDFVRFADESNIPCQARGSACGSLVAHVLGLSKVCPLKYDLLFERFLDPSRTEPPDIDIDFCRDQRQLVIDYIKGKYGEENVAQIGTFGTLKAKAAIRDVGRVLSVPLARVNEIAKMVPETLGIKLQDALVESPELKEEYDADNDVREMIDIAMRLEGLARSAGTHAAGVVMADEPLDRYVPLQKISGKDDFVTQWDMSAVEKAGLLKMDFLGLRNLTILDKSVQNVRKHRGIEIDPVQLPLDDAETFALLERGETKGIFQFESDGIRDLLMKMKPDSFKDIIATSALYRPGPLEGGMVMTYVDVKHGRHSIPKMHPIVDQILEETYGVMVYQEQVMRILNRVGGIELSDAYQCIKAISKKKLSIIARYREEFFGGAQQRELKESTAAELFGMIEKFAGYGFNKSHSTAYGAISYQTAYLKAHYPQEFMAALLSCEMENTDRISEHIDDTRRMRIEVVPPDVNRSDVQFSVEGEQVTFGLGALKGVGKQAVGAVVREREANGPYKNIFDLTERVDPKSLTKGVLEILIKAGALDNLGPNRAQHLLVVDRAIQSAAAMYRDRQRGQNRLFEDADIGQDGKTARTVLPDAQDWPQSQKLVFEREVFGFYLTSHPLTKHANRIKKYVTHTMTDLERLDDRTEVCLGGMISAIKRASTKKPSRSGHTRYVNFDLEDSQGSIRCIIWPDEYSKLSEKVTAEAICFIKGKMDRRGRTPNVIVHNVLTLEQGDKEFAKQIAIKLKRGLHTEDEMVRIRDVLKRFPGRTDVVLILDTLNNENTKSGSRYILRVPSDLRVSCSQELQDELAGLLGRDNFELHSATCVKNGHANRNVRLRMTAL